GAIEDSKMLVLDMRRAFDGSGGVDEADDGVALVFGVAELEERRWNRLIDDLDHSAADQLFEFNEREIGFDAGGIAIHHEADGSGGGQYGDLRVAVSVLFAVSESLIPTVARGIEEFLGNVAAVDVVDRSAMHADDVEEGFAIDVEAGARATWSSLFAILLLESFSGGRKRGALLGNLRRLEIGLSAHDGRERGGIVASGIGVVRQASGHEKSTEVCVTESEGTEVMRVAADGFRRITGVVDEDLLRGDEHIDSMAICGDVEGSVGRELEQVHRREVAG